MKAQKEQACVTHFGSWLRRGLHAHTHILNSELAGELRQNVDEGHTCQLCQVKSH